VGATAYNEFWISPPSVMQRSTSREPELRRISQMGAMGVGQQPLAAEVSPMQASDDEAVKSVPVSALRALRRVSSVEIGATAYNEFWIRDAYRVWPGGVDTGGHCVDVPNNAVEREPAD